MIHQLGSSHTSSLIRRKGSRSLALFTNSGRRVNQTGGNESGNGNTLLFIGEEIGGAFETVEGSVLHDLETIGNDSLDTRSDSIFALQIEV